jgi:hypothetical protein
MKQRLTTTFSSPLPIALSLANTWPARRSLAPGCRWCNDPISGAGGQDRVESLPPVLIPDAHRALQGQRQKCRHHIPKQKRRLTNWPSYDSEPPPARRSDGMGQHGGDRCLARRATDQTGRPTWYSPLGILAALTLRAVFRLALRQTEGLIGSVIRLLGLNLPVPDHTTLSRRAETLVVPRPRSSNGAEHRAGWFGGFVRGVPMGAYAARSVPIPHRRYRLHSVAHRVDIWRA